MMQSLKLNWKVYSMEAICLGLFMISASLFGTLLYFPSSPFYVDSGFLRDCLMGIAMGVSAMLIIYSPMGKLSGAHMNPAFTITFWSLGKIKGWDTFYYSLFQCMGGVAAVYAMHFLLGAAFEDSHVNYVITAPGKFGVAGAFITEIVIAFFMMLMVLITTNIEKTANATGFFCGYSCDDVCDCIRTNLWFWYESSAVISISNSFRYVSIFLDIHNSTIHWDVCRCGAL